MLLNIVLAAIGSCLPLVMGYLALHVTIHPPTDMKNRRKRKWQFVILSLITSAISVEQLWGNYREQERTHADQARTQAKIVAYSQAVDKGYSKLQEMMSDKCLNESQVKGLTATCFSEIRTLAARVDALKPSQREAAQLATVPDVKSSLPASTTENTNPPVAKRIPLSEQLAVSDSIGIVVKYGGGAQCFDSYQNIVQQGCADAECKIACITVLEEEPTKDHNMEPTKGK